MIKVVPSDSFDFGMPVASLVRLHHRGVDRDWLIKSSSADIFGGLLSDLKPEKDHSYIRLISLGAMETYGANRNLDAFNVKRSSFELPEPKPGVPRVVELAGGLMEHHDTFAKHAHVFRQHKNSDPKLAIGQVKAAAYNRRMDRGELVIRVPHDDEWNDDLQKLASGSDLGFSMSCRVATDLCSICGNRARSRKEYCSHLRDHMGDMAKSGHQSFAVNDAPDFFDISKVVRPADRIAWSLYKAASASVGGAELAEQLGIFEPPFNPAAQLSVRRSKSAAAKLAAVRKLAEIEKQIDAAAAGGDNAHLTEARGCPCDAVPGSTMDKMRAMRLGAVLRGMSEANICLSLADFTRLVMGEGLSGPMSDDVCGAEDMMPGMFGRMSGGDPSGPAADGTYDADDGEVVPKAVRDLMSLLSGGHSLSSEPAARRIRITIIRGGRPMDRTAAVKSASYSGGPGKAAQVLAEEYAKYQLSFVAAAGGDDLVTRLTVLRNRFTV